MPLQIITRVAKSPSKGDEEFEGQVYTNGRTKHSIQLVGSVNSQELLDLIKRLVNERNEMKQRMEEAEAYIVRMEQEKVSYGPH